MRFRTDLLLIFHSFAQAPTCVSYRKIQCFLKVAPSGNELRLLKKIVRFSTLKSTKNQQKNNKNTHENQSPVLDAFFELFFKDFAVLGEPLRGRLASIFRISINGRAHFGLAWRASGVFELS